MKEKCLAFYCKIQDLNIQCQEWKRKILKTNIEKHYDMGFNTST